MLFYLIIVRYILKLAINIKFIIKTLFLALFNILLGYFF
jgi:hypothetical protein